MDILVHDGTLNYFSCNLPDSFDVTTGGQGPSHVHSAGIV